MSKELLTFGFCFYFRAVPSRAFSCVVAITCSPEDKRDKLFALTSSSDCDEKMSATATSVVRDLTEGTGAWWWTDQSAHVGERELLWLLSVIISRS